LARVADWTFTRKPMRKERGESGVKPSHSKFDIFDLAVRII
jgi:hypothetical protein